jgi:hypothetical protein
MEAFHVDESLVTIVANTSPSQEAVSEVELREHIAVLSRASCDE